MKWLFGLITLGLVGFGGYYCVKLFNELPTSVKDRYMFLVLSIIVVSVILLIGIGRIDKKG